MEQSARLEWSLLALRLGVFLVMLVWTIDNFVDPAHLVRIIGHFYFIKDVPLGLVYAIGVVKAVILLAFVCGVCKRWSYGLILAFHALTTLASWRQYIPGDSYSLLFFAAWPMLSACVALYLLRDSDTLWTVKLPARG